MAYVLNFSSITNPGQGSVTPISTETNTAYPQILIGLSGTALAISQRH
jgi:hypothetical protein